MKKIKAFACLCFAAVLLFAGCADDKSNNASENDTSESLLSEETISGDGDSSTDISAPDGIASNTASSNNPGTASNVTASSAPSKQDLSQLDTSDYSGSFGAYTTLTDPASGVPVMGRRPALRLDGAGAVRLGLCFHQQSLHRKHNIHKPGSKGSGSDSNRSRLSAKL